MTKHMHVDKGSFLYTGNNGLALIIRILALIALWLLLNSCASKRPLEAEQMNAQSGMNETDQMQVVDCLLPPQVRRLGTHFTYMAARRPLRTTARDCAVRGGEYAAYDRANYATALKVWLPQAKQGDPEAQTYVGEIFEKGLGLPPDYPAAAKWYRLAAQQGYEPAQINLGFLYEKGLGVEQNLVEALNWYRKASGLEEKQIAFASSVEGISQQLEQLRKDATHYKREADSLRLKLQKARHKLEQTQTELQRRQSEFKHSQQKLNALQEQLAQKKAALADSSKSSEILYLETQLGEQKAELYRKQQLIVQLEETAAQQQQALKYLKQGAARFATDTTEEIKTLKAALDHRNDDITALRQQLAATQEQLQKARADLEQRDKNSSAKLVQFKQQQLLGLEQVNQKQSESLEQQKARIKELEALLANESRKKALAQGANKKIAVVAPTIEVIEPPLVISRGTPAAHTRSGLEARPVVGKIVAPGGLLALTVNEQEQRVDDHGLFKTNVPIRGEKTLVSIVAVDRNGKRSAIEFTLVPDRSPASNLSALSLPQDDTPPKSLLPPSLFGNYYALVIGNNKYQHLPHLDTAMRDAEVLGNILKNKYGFKTQVLLNATRYEMMKALNEYRKNLSEDDNLLIYYAGHGTLDKVNDRGHWLPVDAEPDSNANWISVQNVTDLLKIMASRHLLVISDSCYSGALTRSSVARLEAGMTAGKRAEWVKQLLKKRSREALSSGGLQPVLDGGGGGHSIFARALINTLQRNSEILAGQRLYRQVSALVNDAAQAQDFDQVPEFAPIRHAGHSGGQFFFVPVSFESQAAVWGSMLNQAWN
ncbi:caspase family protein [Nitrosococcus wardiae]|uniref:Caspase family p20 domain-containing protein n=1 Tax=Nitrosococcus wardiae TaxID=1814290 RepID=A0A4P7BYM8_9GAMM|nr:caspase family protein [Nitrosococcus wardiae]QBQ55181.1 hypothetical protein E3U44_12180 [Nitrosococcus wardiae]